MEKAGIYHQPASSYAYSYDAKTLHIRIRTKRLDISEVTLIVMTLTYGKMEMAK